MHINFHALRWPRASFVAMPRSNTFAAVSAVILLASTFSIAARAQSTEPTPSPSPSPVEPARDDNQDDSALVDLTDQELGELRQSQGDQASGAASSRAISRSGMDVQFLGAQFGWSNVMVADRHTPIFVELSSEKNIVSGTVTLAFKQDQSQNAQVSAPFTTRPGVITRVEIPVALPKSCPRLDIIISDGRRQLTIPYEVGNDQSAGPPPQAARGFMPIMLVDVPALRESFLLTSLGALRSDGNPDTTGRMNRALPVAVRASALPTSWISYEGVELVAITQDKLAAADPRAREALRAWLHAGGQMLLFVSGAGTEWAQLVLPADQAGSPLPIELDDQRTLSLSARWEARLGGAGLLAVRDEKGLGTLPARAITLTQAGTLAGWHGALGKINDDSNTASKPDQFIAATGPAGLGWLTVAGFDPKIFEDRVRDSRRDDFVRPLLMQGAIVNAARDVAAFADKSGYGAYGVDRVSQAQNAALTAVVKVQTIGAGLMLALGAVVILLIAAVGPMGRWAVRRTVGLSRSWLYAFAAVALATVASAFLPRLVRSGKSSASWVKTIDVQCNAQGQPVAAWSSSVIGLFAGRELPVSFVLERSQSNERVTPSSTILMNGAFVRGISPREYDYGNRSEQTVFGAPLSLAISAPTLGNMRSHVIAQSRVPQWNLRAYALNDAGRSVDGLPSVTLSLDAGVSLAVTPSATAQSPTSGLMRFRIDGLPPSETITQVQVLLADRRGMYVGSETSGAVQLVLPKASITVTEYSKLLYSYWNQQNSPTMALQTPWRDANPAPVALDSSYHSGSIGFCMERAYALDAAIAGGGSALVLVQTQAKELPEVRFNSTTEENTGLVLYRLLVPLSPEQRELLAAAGKPPAASKGEVTSTLYSGPPQTTQPKETDK